MLALTEFIQKHLLVERGNDRWSRKLQVIWHLERLECLISDILVLKLLFQVMFLGLDIVLTDNMLAARYFTLPVSHFNLRK